MKEAVKVRICADITRAYMHRDDLRDYFLRVDDIILINYLSGDIKSDEFDSLYRFAIRITL